jgi:hypothetical protein
MQSVACRLVGLASTQLRASSVSCSTRARIAAGAAALWCEGCIGQPCDCKVCEPPQRAHTRGISAAHRLHRCISAAQQRTPGSAATAPRRRGRRWVVIVRAGALQVAGSAAPRVASKSGAGSTALSCAAERRAARRCRQCGGAERARQARDAARSCPQRRTACAHARRLGAATLAHATRARRRSARLSRSHGSQPPAGADCSRSAAWRRTHRCSSESGRPGVRCRAADVQRPTPRAPHPCADAPCACTSMRRLDGKRGGRLPTTKPTAPLPANGGGCRRRGCRSPPRRMTCSSPRLRCEGARQRRRNAEEEQKK